LHLLVRQLLLDRGIVACDISRYTQSQFHMMGYHTSTEASRFVQVLAYGHEQLGDAQTVMEALAFPQTPERHAYHALVAVEECPPDDMPESHLLTDLTQFFPRGFQQLLPQPEVQPAIYDVLRYATPTEDSQDFIKHFLIRRTQ
jgi:hypothetical protein